MIKAQTNQKKYYDSNTKEIEYNVNDLVLLKAISAPGKFNFRWRGPFKIIQRISKLNYKIQLNNNDLAPIFIVHVNRIKPYQKGDQEQQNINVKRNLPTRKIPRISEELGRPIKRGRPKNNINKPAVKQQRIVVKLPQRKNSRYNLRPKKS